MAELIEHLMHDQLLIFATPVFLLTMIVEIYISQRQHLKLYDKRDTLTSMSLGLISLIVEVAFKLVALIVFTKLHDLSPLKDVIVRQWWVIVILFFLDDFSYYWFHRMNHQVRLFWAGHVNHHSSVHFNYATALRQGVGERSHKYIFWLWLPLLGFDGVLLLTMMAANLIFQFFVHTELIHKFPKPIEFIFNTPSHHRAHHASNIRYLDTNHAGVLIIWDRMFGTFSEELDRERPIYGLTKNLTTDRLSDIVVHEYVAIWRDVKRVKKWSDKMKYIFYAPGWSHDREDLRANTLRRALLEQERDDPDLSKT
jgi:sterol desaturase/sphingolipid hydroxylase (fatty acid hydroxylase superfamily)